MDLKSLLFKLQHWETWHYLAKYIPIMPVWLWYCLKARTFWFFTPSNPTLTFGGFEGERKTEMFAQLPPGSYPLTILVSAKLDFDEVLRQISLYPLVYPLAAKPDIGMMGLMFRKIDSPEKLRIYHHAMPVDYVIQQFVAYPLEVSIFYYRFPAANTGTITGFIRKDFLEVTGDGHSNLLELMLKSSRLRFRLDEMKSKHEHRLGNILRQGETFILSNALNLSRGGKMVSLAHEKDPLLLALFDKFSHYSKHFYYGRYDIKCNSLNELKQGKNFYILEYNGCGAEPHHIYGNGHTLFKAYRIVLQHWKVLYKISSYNHRNGVPYWTFRAGWEHLKNSKNHFRNLKKLDIATEI